MQTRRGLGRGLGALIPTGPAEDEATPGSAVSDVTDVSHPLLIAATPVPGGSPLEPVTGAHYAEIPVHAVRPNAQQPREVFDEDEMAELVHSIREVGVLQPVVVRPHSDGSYELVMGERRWRAARAAGLDAVPAIIRVTADQDLLRDALLENLHRAQLNPLEEASAYRQLLDDFGCSQEELSSRIGRSRPQISNTLRLLRLTPAVQRRVAAGVLSAGHAKALVALDDAAAQERLATRVVAEGLSVRATEEVVSLGGDQSEARPRRRRAARRPAPEVEERLAEQLDTRVRIEAGRSRGRIVIEFATDEDLGRIVDLIDPPRTADASEWTHSSDLSN